MSWKVLDAAFSLGFDETLAIARLAHSFHYALGFHGWKRKVIQVIAT
jgi:phage replication-related protein YjqB (UPF0714/DUF867 family)